LVERLVAHLRPLAFQVSLVLSPSVLLLATLGLAGSLPALVGGLTHAWRLFLGRGSVDPPPQTPR